VGIFLSQAFTIGLLATRHQREIAITTALGLVSIFALGLALIPPLDSTGGAIAAVVADLLLAVFTFVALRHAGPGKTLRFGFVPRVAVAALAAGAIAFVPGVPELALAAVAAIVYAVVAYAVGAVPREVLDAFRRAAPASDSNAST
jgi:O-antigen/teichoic acid export membrane protein